MRQKRHIIKLLIIAAITAMTFASCHSSKTTTRWEDPIYARNDKPKSGKSKDKSKPQTERPKVKVEGTRQSVIDAACDWIGVPYKYGGDTKKGVDCSGLICMAFEKGANLKLPRNSSAQAQACKNISKSKLRPGDLIFFVSRRGGKRINHVALYIGEDMIVHATTSQGVVISCLCDDYWQSHLHSCGRVFND